MKEVKKSSLFVLFIVVALIVCLSVTAVFAFKNTGSFATNSGADINLRIEWSVENETEDNKPEVTAKVYLDCYSLSVSARKDNTLSINGNKITFDTPAMKYKDNTFRSVLLAEHSVEINRLPGMVVECEIKADWAFNGVYGGKEVGVLSVSETLIITDNGVTIFGQQTEEIPEETKPVEKVEETEAPPETEAPEIPDVVSPEVSKVIEVSSETGAYLDIVCELQVSEFLTDKDKLNVTATLYLEYYSLYLGTKQNCRLTVGDKIVTFNVPAISQEEEKAHRLKLTELTVECAKNKEIAVKATVPFKGKYGAVEIDNLVIDKTITLN